jgi:hypothetical protein
VAGASWELHLLLGFDVMDVEPPTSAMIVLNCIMRRGIIYMKPCLVEGVVMSVIKARDLLQYFVINFNVW